MSRQHGVVLTRAAREAGIPLDELHRAALSAVNTRQSEGIWFQAFRVRGRQFALSTRVVVEVDHFPHRVPERVLEAPRKGLHRIRPAR